MFFRGSGRLSGTRQHGKSRLASQTGKVDSTPQHRAAGVSYDMVSLVVHWLRVGFHNPRKRNSVRHSHRANPTGSNWTSRLATGLLLAAGVAVLAIGVTIRIANLSLDTVLSNSMQPTLSAGDVAVTQAVPTDSVRAGDVIAFVAPGRGRILIHRVASLEAGVITTRGDANPVDDPWRFTLTGPTAHRLVAVVPYVGWLTKLQQPTLLLAGVLMALIILLELRKEVGKRLPKSRIQHQLRPGGRVPSGNSNL